MVLVFSLLAAAVLAFSFEWMAAEVVALGLMVSFVIAGILSPEAAFAGFANETVLMILGLLIMTAVIGRTGLMQFVSRVLLRATGASGPRFLWLLMLTAGTLSSFMSNTAATAFFIPVVMGVARRLKLPESHFLLPLAFASILSSSVSLIATSTNLVVSGLMKNAGMKPMGMFELTPAGLPILALGILYLGTIGVRIMRARIGTQTAGFAEPPASTVYTGELLVLENSPFAEKTIADARLGSRYDVQIIRVMRRKTEALRPAPELVLKAGDVLVAEADHEALLAIKKVAGLELKAESKLESGENGGQESRIVEAVVLPGSTVAGRSLKETRFRDRHGVIVLGIQKSGRSVRKLSQVKIGVGDVLLLQGPPEELAALEEEHAFRLIGETLPAPISARRSAFIATVFVAAIAAGVLQIVPLPVAVLTGAFLMLASGIVNPEIIFREVEWKAVILIACMLSAGEALRASGADRLIADSLAGAVRGASPVWLIAGVFLITVGLSQPMSNQAAAALVLPVAITSAIALGINPRAVAMTVAVAASCSFLTPLEPSCLMVYGPGNYRFKDFLLVGLPLTVLIFALTLILVPWLWPLRA